MTAPMNIPLPVARRIAERLAAKRNVTLLFPDSFPDNLVSDALVPLVALAYSASGSSVTKTQVEQSVSFTLPGIPGPALDMLNLIPAVSGIPVGSILLGICTGLRKTVIRLSPDACKDGATMLTTLDHEFYHADCIARNGIGGLLAYAIPEGRAGAEGPAYGQTLAGMVYFSGADIRTAAQQIKASLGTYSFDLDSETMADTMVDQSMVSIEDGAPIGGPFAETVVELKAEGIDVSSIPV